MKTINLTIATLAILITMNTASTAQTTTNTTESFTYTKDDQDNKSILSSKKSMTVERKTDKEILKLLDSKINEYPDLDDDVSFSVREGVIILKGTVENTSERGHAGMLAESIPGVIRVDNLIDVE